MSTFSQPHRSENSVLIQFLMDKRYASPEQIQELREYMTRHSASFADAIQNTQILGDPSDVIQFIAEAENVPFARLDGILADAEALSKLPQEHAFSLTCFPLKFDPQGRLIVVTSIEQVRSTQIKRDLIKLTGLPIDRIVMAVGLKTDITRAIQMYYRPDDELRALTEDSDDEDIDESVSAPEALIGTEVDDDNRVSKFVNLIILQAVKDGVSDIHFDPTETGIVVRYRLDGKLKDITYAPVHMMPNITARLKILSELDISKTRIPQDGRIGIKIGKRKIDLRVATLPSVFGEKIVMRVLDNTAAQKELQQLGFSQENFDRFLGAATKPYGMVLVTGPTGSGKSTTLYAALNEIKNPELNIITAEDPVEYQLKGITQVPVHHELTFARVLRTVLRADPDVILIGEIRDEETAEIAMKAGMTGHMVFSTLHTNDAASALTRLTDMQVQPFITASTVNAIVAQRLLRRLCERCKVPQNFDQYELEQMGYEHNTDRDGTPTFFKAVGCPACSGGYKGRMAIHEVLLMSDTLEEAILHGAKAYELNQKAIAEGMISMQQDGLRKAAAGLTTVEEVLQAVGG